MTPKAQISAFAPLQGTFRTSSGHMQAGVPQKLLRLIREDALKPKSISLILPWSSIRMFSGLRSRWHTPFQWQYPTPSRIYLKYRRAIAQGKVFSFLSSPPKLCLPAFSMMRQSFLCSLAKSCSFTTLELSRDFRWRIYRLMQARRFQSSASIFQQALIAYVCLLSRPTAMETIENAPFPMCDIIFRSFSTSLLDMNSSKQATFSTRLWLVVGRLVVTSLGYLGVVVLPTDIPRTGLVLLNPPSLLAFSVLDLSRSLERIGVGIFLFT